MEPADRERYANDPSVLLGAKNDADLQKGDKGPEAWRPPNASYHCKYARRWISTKSDWGLSANAAERNALKETLGTCGTGS